MKKIIDRLASGLLVLLGFSAASCDGSEKLVMYGTPTANYKIKGKVVDSAAPTVGIPGIRIILKAKSYRPDTLYSASDGTFLYQAVRDLGPTSELPVRLEDVDGAANGSYQTRELDLEFEAADRSRTGDWVTTVTKNDVLFTLDSEDE